MHNKKNRESGFSDILSYMIPKKKLPVSILIISVVVLLVGAYLKYMTNDQTGMKEESVDYLKDNASQVSDHVSIGAFTLALDFDPVDVDMTVYGPQLLGPGYIILDEVIARDGSKVVFDREFEPQEKDTFTMIANYEEIKTPKGSYFSGDRKLHIDTYRKDIATIKGRIIAQAVNGEEAVLPFTWNLKDQESL